jgi:hypothetical protein
MKKFALVAVVFSMVAGVVGCGSSACDDAKKAASDCCASLTDAAKKSCEDQLAKQDWSALSDDQCKAAQATYEALCPAK